MQRTTTYERGDVVLVNYRFSDQSGQKRRPALVVSSPTYNVGRQDLILAAITSNARRVLTGDTVLQDWQTSGLVSPSVATGTLRTISRRSIRRSLGSVSQRDMTAVEANLRVAMAL